MTMPETTTEIYGGNRNLSSVPTIRQMERAGWEFVTGSSAYEICAWRPDRKRAGTVRCNRAFTPSRAQRAEWLDDYEER